MRNGVTTRNLVIFQLVTLPKSETRSVISRNNLKTYSGRLALIDSATRRAYRTSLTLGPNIKTSFGGRRRCRYFFVRVSNSPTSGFDGAKSSSVLIVHAPPAVF